MAKVHITNVVVFDNPSSFFNPFQFVLTFECIGKLKDNLEWKMIYVGSAESEEYDQVLDTVYIAPVPEGRHIFVFHADAPDISKIPESEVIGVTVILLTCSYRGQEFVRMGYYLTNDYADQKLRKNPPSKPIFNKLMRNILETKPHMTRFKINWDYGYGINRCDKDKQMIMDNDPKRKKKKKKFAIYTGQEWWRTADYE